MKKKLIFLLLGIIVVLGCVAESQVQKTSLELLAIQSRNFEGNKKMTFASVSSVFKDLGYVINSAEINTGFIVAKSPTKSEQGFGKKIMTDTKATAFVEELKPGNTRVRLNFVETTERSFKNGGKDVEDNPILDPTIYQNAFTRIQEGIFIRKATQ